jgi:hypothetical protein
LKPELIDCGNGCKWCDGYGIMTLFPQGWLAPCIQCSPDKNLRDLEARKFAAINAMERAKEKAEIAKHNERISSAVEKS